MVVGSENKFMNKNTSDPIHLLKQPPGVCWQHFINLVQIDSKSWIPPSPPKKMPQFEETVLYLCSKAQQFLLLSILKKQNMFQIDAPTHQ